MAPNWIQGAAGGSTSAGVISSYALTLTTAVSCGNSLCIATCVDNSAFTTFSVLAGGTAVNNSSIVLIDPTNNQKTTVYWLTNITNGATQVTVTASGPNFGFFTIMADEFSGVSTNSSNRIDVNMGTNQNPAPGTGTDAVTSGSATTANSGDLIWGVTFNQTGTGNPASAGTGYTGITDSGSAFSSSNSFRCRGNTEWHVAGAAGSTAATFTQANNDLRTTFMVSLIAAPSNIVTALSENWASNWIKTEVVNY
jgi:hypothetical protein